LNGGYLERGNSTTAATFSLRRLVCVVNETKQKKGFKKEKKRKIMNRGKRLASVRVTFFDQGITVPRNGGETHGEDSWEVQSKGVFGSLRAEESAAGQKTFTAASSGCWVLRVESGTAGLVQRILLFLVETRVTAVSLRISQH
jgi:hypothetical protein